MNTDSLWTRLKQSVRESASMAAEKAEHLGKVGRARLDIAETRHAIGDVFTELGGRLYDHVQSSADGSVTERSEVQGLIDKVRGLEAELKAREAVLESLKAADGAHTEDAATP